MLLPLSCFSCVRLCVTQYTSAHQAPPSLGFSSQEHWSGLPFPSPMHESEVAQSCLTQRPHGLQPTRLLRPWDFPGKSTGVGFHCLLRWLIYLCLIWHNSVFCGTWTFCSDISIVSYYIEDVYVCTYYNRET